ncbi:hypothetical protein V1477_018922 [Vespula maculifrons]|uniref:Uncharacterized protein n=1 Tax=Vespula maculifrons TaxID=7453 RepID=A0ABD2AT71_VESMC
MYSLLYYLIDEKKLKKYSYRRQSLLLLCIQNRLYKKAPQKLIEDGTAYHKNRQKASIKRQSSNF